MLTAVG